MVETLVLDLIGKMSKIEYTGRKGFERARKLSEPTNTFFTPEALKDLVKPISDEREEGITELFKGLANTYLKGTKLQTALRNMDPAQFIPIEPDNDNVSIAAERLNKEQSQNGTVITYSMYANAIDSLLGNQWKLRLNYTKVSIPATVKSQHSKYSEQRNKSSSSNLFSDFLAQNGIASCIIGMLTLSPFQTIIFQGLSGEESAAKGIQIAQIAPGIALLLELGIKAEKILRLLKECKISTPLVEQQVVALKNDPNARNLALQSIGLDRSTIDQTTELNDNEIIVNYVSEYFQRYGGLVNQSSHLTLDHWISYSSVARNQQTIKGCLNISSKFSKTFADIEKQSLSAEVEFVTTEQTKPSKMLVQLASATRALKERSDDMYDDIVDAMQYQLTDRDLCCMVQIFGANYSTDMLKTIANILRILAVDLSGELIQIDNILRRWLASVFQDSLFEIAAQFNEFYYKVVGKLTKMFTIDIEGAEACGGLLTIGLALLQSVRVIFEQIEALVSEISSLIGDYGNPHAGSWTISADRRHLLGTARVLEVLAARLDTAKACDKVNSGTYSSNPTIDEIDIDGSAILSIIEKSEPKLNLTAEDEQKYFSNRKPRSSARLKFAYGIKDEQNNSSTDSRNCSDSSYNQKIENLIQNFKTALSNLDE